MKAKQHAEMVSECDKAPADPVAAELRAEDTGQQRAGQGCQRHRQQGGSSESLTHVVVLLMNLRFSPERIEFVHIDAGLVGGTAAPGWPAMADSAAATVE